MAEPQRSDTHDHAAGPWTLPASNGYQPGGRVGEMHAELAQRLGPVLPGTAPPVESPAERGVRLLSMAGGWAALGAGYAGIAWLLLR